MAGRTGGVGGLFAVSALGALPAARAVAGFDIELRDQGHDGRQIGLILDDEARIDQGHLAIGTEATGHVDPAVDAFGRRRGPQVGWMSWFATRFFAACLALAAAEGSGLAVELPPGVLHFLAEPAVVFFQPRETAQEAPVIDFQLRHPLL